AARLGVEPGMKVQSIDGAPFAERVARQRAEMGNSSSDRATVLLSYYYVLTGEPDSTLQLGLTGSDGRPVNVTLTRRLVGIAQPVLPKVLPSGYAYIRFAVFNESVARQFRQALEKVKDAPGLIIDLRGNGGGNFPGVLRIADYFFPDRVTFGHVNGRSGKRPSFILRWLGVPSELEVGHAGGQIYEGPVVILVNDGSGSGAELFSAGMQENGRAAIVGRQTCGCVLGSVSHRVKGGGEVGISEFDIITAKGRRLEGSGVTPDVLVPLTIDDLRSHRDSALRQAVAILTSSGTRSAAR
ncbi:MAG TPA: S41 family peptidase, partial [Terriglobales bacterium]